MFDVSAVEEGVVRFLMARRLLGRNFYRAACYWVDGLLVDTGIHWRRADLASAISGRRVDAIVNTHAHEDHMGANGLLQRERGVPVFAHEAALPILAAPRTLRLRPYQRFFFGEPEGSRAVALGDCVRSERCRFRVVGTPGHSPDHVALFEETRGWLFAGDAYIGGLDRVSRGSYDIAAMRRSWRTLASLRAEVMFTGAGSVARRPSRKFERKLAYYDELAGRVAELRRAGLGVPEIARRLFPGDRAVRLVTSGDFSAEKLVRPLFEEAGGA